VSPAAGSAAETSRPDTAAIPVAPPDTGHGPQRPIRRRPDTPRQVADTAAGGQSPQEADDEPQASLITAAAVALYPSTLVNLIRSTQAERTPASDRRGHRTRLPDTRTSGSPGAAGRLRPRQGAADTAAAVPAGQRTAGSVRHDHYRTAVSALGPCYRGGNAATSASEHQCRSRGSAVTTPPTRLETSSREMDERLSDHRGSMGRQSGPQAHRRLSGCLLPLLGIRNQHALSNPSCGSLSQLGRFRLAHGTMSTLLIAAKLVP
jgi:hypothetical protein